MKGRLLWIHENPAVWDAGKARLVGRAREGVFDVRFGRAREGDLVPGEWWRAEDAGRTVAYGWLDVTWGDAEILLAVDPEARDRGVGSFVLAQLEHEASARGLNYLCNVVRPTHPDGERVTRWLTARGFSREADGRLVRRVRPLERTSSF